MTITTPHINEYTVLEGILKNLKAIVIRESKRPQGCEDLTPSMLALLEEEIIPQLENELDYDPILQYLYDNTGGESPITANEMYEIARAHSKLLHS